MSAKKRVGLWQLMPVGAIVLVALILSACGAQSPTTAPPTHTPTSALPTDTPAAVPPTHTPTSVPPTNTPAAVPTATLGPEVLASRAEDIIGVWLGRGEEGIKIHIEYTKEGTYRAVGVSGAAKGVTIDQGKFWFEDAQLKLESEGGRCLTAQGEVITCIGIYQVYVVKEGDKPVQLRFVVVKDQYADRKNATHNKTLPRVEP